MGVKDAFYYTEVIMCFICPVGYIIFSKWITLFSPGHVFFHGMDKAFVNKKVRNQNWSTFQLSPIRVHKVITGGKIS